MSLEPTLVVDLQHKMDKLKEEHRQISFEIDQLISQTLETGDIRIHRLKKRRLLIKDQIQKIDALLVPDIIA
jgi:hypothetical protein